MSKRSNEMKRHAIVTFGGRAIRLALIAALCVGFAGCKTTKGDKCSSCPYDTESNEKVLANINEKADELERNAKKTVDELERSAKKTADEVDNSLNEFNSKASDALKDRSTYNDSRDDDMSASVAMTPEVENANEGFVGNTGDVANARPSLPTKTETEASVVQSPNSAGSNSSADATENVPNNTTGASSNVSQDGQGADVPAVPQDQVAQSGEAAPPAEGYASVAPTPGQADEGSAPQAADVQSEPEQDAARPAESEAAEEQRAVSRPEQESAQNPDQNPAPANDADSSQGTENQEPEWMNDDKVVAAPLRNYGAKVQFKAAVAPKTVEAELVPTTGSTRKVLTKPYNAKRSNASSTPNYSNYATGRAIDASKSPNAVRRAQVGSGKPAVVSTSSSDSARSAAAVPRDYSSYATGRAIDASKSPNTVRNAFRSSQPFGGSD